MCKPVVVGQVDGLSQSTVRAKFEWSKIQVVQMG
jgi:hypothetical protein